MEVIYYQIFILITIVVTSFFSKKASLVVCGFWTLFTFAMVFTLPLAIVQLATVGGSYWITEKIREVRKLKHALKHLSDEQKSKTSTIPAGNMRLLEKNEHYDYLLKSIRDAQKKVVILSGWITSYVVDSKFNRLLLTKLKSGVAVYIGYGWENSQGQHVNMEASEKSLLALKKLAKKYPNQLLVAKYATHEKLLVVDDKEVVFGSANWLSNRRYTNDERSIVITDAGLARSEARRVEQLVRKNAV